MMTDQGAGQYVSVGEELLSVADALVDLAISLGPAGPGQVCLGLQ